jgi:Tfp pilus assembly protein PilO
MSTTLIPLDPALTAAHSHRVPTISANLLPEEIVAARQARRSRGLVLIVVAVVAVMCATWFGFAYNQKQQADEQLTEATATVTQLQLSQREFTETLQVQADTRQLSNQLKAVMANDVDWAGLLSTLRRAGSPSNITVSDVSGKVDLAEETPGTTTQLPGSATDTVGSVLVSGGAPDKAAVAAYVDALGRQSVVTNPYVTTVATAESGGVSFSLKVDLTRAALCGRFTTACKGDN